MKLTVFNGSGRSKSGNTAVLLKAFLKGFTSVEGNTYETHYLIQSGKLETHTTAFAEAEHVLLAFPMYTDMVPGVVKAFVETLAPFCGRDDNPSIGFILHCGFPEAVQLRALERYMDKLARRLGCRHAGTILKGNSEGLRTTPPEKLSGLNVLLGGLGQSFAERGEYDRELIIKLAQPEILPKPLTYLFRILALTPFMNTGWDNDLKKNGAYKRRFARPYENKGKQKPG